MKVAIMQPYFLPYIGYWQLINAVDVFVVYDNIQYTKKGWVNRNRILVNGNPETITIPVKDDSHTLDICQRYLSDDYIRHAERLINKIAECYHKAPMFDRVFDVIKEILEYGAWLRNDPECKPDLFHFLITSIRRIAKYLEIDTKIVVSSTINADHALKSDERVMSICKALGADTYINPIGGVELYSKQQFKDNGIELHFLKSDPLTYPQYKDESCCVQSLSILDVMMFNPSARIRDYLKMYHLE